MKNEMISSKSSFINRTEKFSLFDDNLEINSQVPINLKSIFEIIMVELAPLKKLPQSQYFYKYLIENISLLKAEPEIYRSIVQIILEKIDLNDIFIYNSQRKFLNYKIKIIYILMNYSFDFASVIQNDYLDKPYIQELILGVKYGLKIFICFKPRKFVLTKTLEAKIIKNLKKNYEIKILTLKLINQYPIQDQKRIFKSIDFDPISDS